MTQRGRPRTLGYTDMTAQQTGVVYKVPDVDFGGRFDQSNGNKRDSKLSKLLKENPEFIPQLRDQR